MRTNKKLYELRRYMDVSKLDINQRVQMIMDEVQQQLKEYEEEAKEIADPELLSKEVQGTL